tara:strand:- start:481 stop:2946 length:2466 start_codon:yes stop_codon:yes gene_type:complete
MSKICENIQPNALYDLLLTIIEDTLKISVDKNYKNYLPILRYVSKLASNQCVAESFHLFEWEKTIQEYLIAFIEKDKAHEITQKFMEDCDARVPKRKVEVDIPEGEGEILCNVEFKLAYGGKILLNTTNFHVRRGRVYGLLGHNGCGKSTLMRAISSGALAGFPGADELMKLNTCFVDHDIDGSESDTPTIDFCLNDPVLAPLGREKIREKLLSMTFKEEHLEKPIKNLSGGFKMMLALAKAVLSKADLILADEPTNHLDTMKQKWLADFISGPECANVTTIVISHDPKFLNRVCTDIIHYENMRLKRYTGNLDKFMEQCPVAKSYFTIKDADVFKMIFPIPGPLEGVKSKTKAILQAKNMSFTYPGGSKPTLKDISVQVSQASRIACIGPNGAGKSTLIKVLVGETKPDIGCPEVYRHQNCRIAYIAQHAFHHIEQHLELSPVEYIQWRFSGGLDKEQQASEAAQMTDEEKEKLKQVFIVYQKELAAELDVAGNATGEREIVFDKMVPLPKGQQPPPVDTQNGIFPDCSRMIKHLVGRRTRHNEYEYEVKWGYPNGTGMDSSKNLYVPRVVLENNGFFKLMKQIDDKIAAEGGSARPLTTSVIQKHLDDFGLTEEFGTYGKIKQMSGGQMIKCVIAASMWFCPHIVVLDEPTNFLDGAALNALRDAIKYFEGGVLLISHNAEFLDGLSPEVWEVPGDQSVKISGSEWMEAVRQKELADARAKKNSIPTQDDEKFDNLGNKIEIQTQNADIDRDMVKKITKQLKLLKERIKNGDFSCEDEYYELEDKLEKANAHLKKEKEAVKKDKEAQKALDKKKKKSKK